MTISAHAPVPPASRLIDADTVDLAAIRKAANTGRFPVNGTYASRTAATSPELLASASEDFKAGYARGYADALGQAVAPAMSDAELLARAATVNPTGVHQLARAITAGCPVWCSEDHRGQVTEEDGFTIGLGHERILTEITADHAAWTDEVATARVFVESCTEAGMVTMAPRITLSVARGTEGRYPDGEETQGWSGNAEQARTLAAALLAAADLLDGGDAR